MELVSELLPVIVGLDCSSKKIGVGIIHENTKKLLEYYTINFLSRTMFENVPTIEKLLEAISSKYSVSHVVIEDYLMGFSGGTSQQTLMILCQINTLLEYTLHRKGYNTSKVNVQTARKAVFGKARQSKLNGKEFVLQEIVKIYPEVEITYTKTGKNTAVGVDDYLDAIVLARSL